MNTSNFFDWLGNTCASNNLRLEEQLVDGPCGVPVLIGYQLTEKRVSLLKGLAYALDLTDTPRKTVAVLSFPNEIRPDTSLPRVTVDGFDAVTYVDEFKVSVHSREYFESCQRIAEGYRKMFGLDAKVELI